MVFTYLDVVFTMYLSKSEKICIMQTRFPDGSDSKVSACNVGDLGSIPGLGKFPGEGKGYPLQCSGEFHGLYSPWGQKESDTTE